MDKHIIVSYFHEFDNSFLSNLDKTLSAYDIACLNLDVKKDEELARKINDICLKNKVGLILARDLELANKIDALGVHIEDETEDYEKLLSGIRNKIGDKVLGVSCFESKDNAMLAEEADYVMFGSLAQHTDVAQMNDWLEEVTILPCLIDYQLATPETSYVHIRLNADCTIPEDAKKFLTNKN